MKLTFFGAAGQVTGSNYLIETGKHKYLVDCGLFQGTHFAENDNFAMFPFDPKEIEAVFVTHAHLDHVGRLPKLYAEGFRGTVYSTPATKDCAEQILLDSEKLLCREAERVGTSPFCTPGAIEGIMRHWKKVEYHTELQHNDVFAYFYDAGHILGSSSIVLKVEGKKILFSGDIGNFPASIVRHTEFIEDADYCVMEATYGDSLHDSDAEREQALERVIESTARSGGTLMIPSFALERAQEILYYINNLFAENRIPRIPVFVDSPLAIKLTAIYPKYQRYFNPEASKIIRSGDDIFNFPGLELTLTSEQSKRINHVQGPKIVIAGSGMSNGGRILHHEERYLSDPQSAILFIGYQAEGSLGRSILEGATEVTIFGNTVPVNCAVYNITSYSAHADRAKLLKWLYPMREHVKRVFITHSEEGVRAAFAARVRDELAIDTVCPTAGESFEL